MSKEQFENIIKFVEAIALKTCVLYLIFGGLWILLSDAIVLYFVHDPVVITQFQTYKGLIFIFVTALLLCAFMRTQITEKALLNNKLIKIERRYKWLVNNTSDIIIVLGENGVINFVGGSYFKVAGYSEKELLGKNIFEIIHPDDIECFRDNFVLNFFQNKENLAVEYRFKHKIGSWLYFESVAAVSADDDCLIPGLLITTRDITKKKELQNQMLRSQRLESVGAIASGVSHDLNNIFSPVVLAVDMLKKEELSPMGRKALETIEKSILHGTRMVDQILAFSKGGSGNRTVTKLSTIVMDVESLIFSMLSKGVSVVLDIQEDLPSIEVDVTQIHQVIVNLCINAKDALPNGGVIKIEGTKKNVDKAGARNLKIAAGEYVVLKVIDNGVGIEDDVKKDIFNPFFTTKSESEGVGLGLPIVKKVVDGHNGAIEVESKKGKGTAFSIYIPVYNEKKSRKDVEEKCNPKIYSDDTILVVESDFSVVSMMQEYFKLCGYKVIHAIDGFVANSFFSAYSDVIKVVILDTNVTNMKISEFVELVKSKSENIPVILTGYKDDQLGEDMKKGADAVITKPYSGENIKKLIDAVQSKSLKIKQ